MGTPDDIADACLFLASPHGELHQRRQPRDPRGWRASRVPGRGRPRLSRPGVDRVDEGDHQLASLRDAEHVELVADAGAMTPVVARVATAIFRHRQRRWHRLARRHLTQPDATGTPT